MSYLGQVELKSSEIRRVDVTSSTSATHTLTWTPPSEQSLIVTINGIKQQNNYTISGTTLTLDTALIVTDAMEVVGILDIGTTNIPADDSITNAMVKSSAAIAQSKLATLVIDTTELADDAVTADKLANAINTSIAANTAKVTNATHTGDVTGATALTIAAGAVDVAMLSATGTASSSTILYGDGTWKAEPATDTSGLEDDIALLGFRVASNGSLAKYNLVDQTIDDFQDATGVDASASTNEFRDVAGSYYYGGSATSSTAWHCGAQAGGAFPSVATKIGTMGAPGGLAAVFDSSNDQAQSACAQGGGSGGDPALSWAGIDLGPLTTLSATQWNIYGSNDYGFNNYAAHGAVVCTLDAANTLTSTSTPANSEWTTILTTGSISGVPGSDTSTFSATSYYRYFRWVFLSQVGGGSSRLADLSLYGTLSSTVEGGDMILIPNTTAAQAAPTKGDIVLTYTNGAGTTTLDTDLTAEISADGGSTWTSLPLASEGSTGSHNIATSHDVTISSTITAPWNMAYRVKTLNQGVSKTTRIQAVSLGWS